jgi:PAS domain S-box-containing protein
LTSRKRPIIIGDETAKEPGIVFSDIGLKIIEELSDGFLILNARGEILFFNEVLLRMTGWRSKDILSQEGAAFLNHLAVHKCRLVERLTPIPDPQGSTRYFRVASFSIEGESEAYTLVRVRQAESSTAAEADSTQGTYELLFQNFGDPLLTVNLRGELINANPAFYHLVGYPPDTEIRDIASLYVYKEELEDKLLRLLQSDSIRNLETHLYNSERIAKRVLDSSWVIRDPRGVVTGYTTELRDISYVKNLEARLTISERSYAVLFDTILSSITIVDPLGRVLNWNYTAQTLYGYSWEEVSGQYFDTVFRSDQDRPTITQIFELVDQNGGRHIESEVPRRRKDGQPVHTYASYSAIYNTDGEVVAYSVIEKDLTERINLEKKLKDSFDQIKETQSAAILGFARLTEYRDKNTGKHLKRIREYTKVLAVALKNHPRYSGYVSDRYIEDLCLCSVLHDVGKVAIEDSILLKSGKLNGAEMERIRDHARMGGDALRDVDRELRRQSFLTLGKEVAYYHHERWDGKGYPEGRRGDEIPLSARIVAVADVYDAMTSERPYKKAASHEETVEVIREGRGSQFDPDIVDAFLAQQEAFRRIKVFHEFEENPATIATLLDTTPGTPRPRLPQPALP